MRDVARIPIMLDKLQKAWLNAPDLRFFQLLITISMGHGDTFYMTDSEVEKIIDDWNKENDAAVI